MIPYYKSVEDFENGIVDTWITDDNVDDFVIVTSDHIDICDIPINPDIILTNCIKIYFFFDCGMFYNIMCFTIIPKKKYIQFALQEPEMCSKLKRFETITGGQSLRLCKWVPRNLKERVMQQSPNYYDQLNRND